MKIDNKNKRKAYNNYLTRSGVGLARHYAKRKLPQSAIDQMHHRPYGGVSHEQEKSNHDSD